jgi:hypothetical protein
MRFPHKSVRVKSTLDAAYLSTPTCVLEGGALFQWGMNRVSSLLKDT